MYKAINKVAVLGAGTMGAQIAGHCANAGIPALMYDLNDELVQNGLNVLTSLKPAPLYDKKNVTLVEGCTYDRDLEKLAEADWIVEAVAENMEIKHKVFQNITPHVKDKVILSTNTSGLSVHGIAEALPENLRKRFLLTHFFNPPRYLRLVEIVTDLAEDNVIKTMVTFLEDVLGKGLVYAKDTPNFIANRIGVYGLMAALKLTEEMALTVEEVDKLTGTIVGRPKSATFRTADVVGLDILSHVANTSFELGKEDEEREMFKIPDVLAKLVQDGRLGQKTKAGFYQKTDEGILTLDFNTMDYVPQKRIRFDGFRLAKEQSLLSGKIKALAWSDDKAGKFFWELLSRTLIYSANRIPEISDDIINVDNAMKWGFGWDIGPFETWDVIGVEESMHRMKEEGKSVPSWVAEMIASGRNSFYAIDQGVKTFYSIVDLAPVEVPLNNKSINLSLIKSKGNVVKKDWSASLIDLGDGILNVEFHSILQPVMNPIDTSVAETINDGLDLVEVGKYKALILNHNGANFCAGANLKLILQFCEDAHWDKLNGIIKLLQNLTQRMRFINAPVVVAPFGLALGGGYELMGPADKRVAAAELYCGLVEVGVGLIPGAAGNLRIILHLTDDGPKKLSPFQISQQALETIGFAKVATSATHAKKLHYLRPDDEIVLNREHLLHRAKQVALEMIDNYQPPSYRDDIKLAGKGGRTAMKVTLKGFKLQGKISAHDEFIARKLAYVVTGGDKGGPTKPVDEQYLLDIEREVFLSLCGEEKTHDRIRYMLKKGKPLRN
ncbi:MAG: 3-hydroxyacyl-CoA dehydrogenase/enoyl-CoA hydratase family protein [Fidelibacterota bacterium]